MKLRNMRDANTEFNILIRSLRCDVQITVASLRILYVKNFDSFRKWCQVELHILTLEYDCADDLNYKNFTVK